MTDHVQTGLDRLLGDEQLLQSLRGARVGLLANPTCVTRDLRHGLDALVERDVEIVRLFGPEHGVRSEAQDMEAVDQSVDDLTGIPVVSLYGTSHDSLRPDRDTIRDLDIVLADIQDVGSRYYTYASTIGFMMEACGKAGTEVWVLDRPNPIGGHLVEGNVVTEGLFSFVGTQPIANRHGMTIGELATYFDRFGGWECDLTVVKMEGWSRSMWYDETGLPWVLPSPNMPTLETATVYPGLCLLEGTNASEGRGTTRPFEFFGAPYVDSRALRRRLEQFELPGVGFREAAFRPMFQKHGGETCFGVQVHVTNRETFDSLATGYAVISALCRRFPDGFDWRRHAYEFVDDELAIDLLLGNADLRRALVSGEDPVELAEQAYRDSAAFRARREQCLLYE